MVAGRPAWMRAWRAGRLAGTALHHVAHDDFLDRAGIDSGPGHRVANDQGAELWRGEA